QQINATLAASNGVVYVEQGDHLSDTLRSEERREGKERRLSATSTVPITVTEVLDASNTVPSSFSATEGVATALTGISISDPDATGNVTTTLSVLHGTLTVAAGVVGGLTAGGIAGSGTGTVTLTGTVQQINATLAASNGVVYVEQGDHLSDTL